jgi:hypothetical protein
MTDFGADGSFVSAARKVREHSGVEVAASSLRRVTYEHGTQMLGAELISAVLPAHGAPTVILESDGAMIPLVEPGSGDDARKDKRHFWAEMKTSLARVSDAVDPVYGATFGTTHDAGDQMLACAIVAGAGQASRIHALGDGARWIVEQVERVFGAQATYLVDLYHVSTYLAAAAAAIAPHEPAPLLRRFKDELCTEQLSSVLTTLETYREPASTTEANAPVRAAYRYLSNRPDQLDYAPALAQDLPVGSGEVESAHRHLVHKRLKLPGAWWHRLNVEPMLALRVTRANHKWNSYWTQFRDAA